MDLRLARVDFTRAIIYPPDAIRQIPVKAVRTEIVLKLYCWFMTYRLTSAIVYHHKMKGNRMNEAAHMGAFVVQFRSSSQDGERFEGRIEHIGTGEVAHFHSAEELLSCIRRMLTEARCRA
jgi:hypothetical protein